MVGWRDNFFIAVMLFGVTTAPLFAAFAGSATPSAGDIVVVIGLDAAEVVRRAGGAEVGLVRATWGVLATGDAGFVDRAHAVGAWAVADAQWLAVLCGKEV